MSNGIKINGFLSHDIATSTTLSSTTLTLSSTYTKVKPDASQTIVNDITALSEGATALLTFDTSSVETSYTVNTNSVGSGNIKLNTNMPTCIISEGRFLHLIYDGTYWTEITRSHPTNSEKQINYIWGGNLNQGTGSIYPVFSGSGTASGLGARSQGIIITDGTLSSLKIISSSATPSGTVDIMVNNVSVYNITLSSGDFTSNGSENLYTTNINISVNANDYIGIKITNPAFNESGYQIVQTYV